MRVVVIGAGLAGLMSAQQLQESGHDVVVLDKGKSPGGRLATRRIGDATLDHGAQLSCSAMDSGGSSSRMVQRVFRPRWSPSLHRCAWHEWHC